MNQHEFLPPGDLARVLAAIAEASADAIVAEDLTGTVLAWSRGAERMYGYLADEIIGRSIAILIPPDRAEELSRTLDRLRQGLGVDTFETVRLARGGSPVDVAITISPLADASGQITGAITVARDIGARLRADVAARTNEARWRAMIDAAVDGVIAIDAIGRIEAFNHSAELMFGYSQGEVRGRNVNILMPSPDHEQHDRYMRHYLETGEQKIIGIGREVVALRRDGTRFPIHLSVGEMRAGSERHFVGILHDLSARVALEERLREQSTLARLGEMAAVIAHEVKNPLTAVRGAIQVIGRRLPAESRDGPVVKEIVARLDGLNALIQDLLLFARTPTLRPAPVDLGSLLRLTADLLQQDPTLKAVAVDVTGSAPPLMADADLMKIVFQNLLINAAQAMGGQGAVRAVISVEGTSARVTIADQGPGLSAEAKEKLFRPFFTTKSRGTGLGLPTARRLLEAHGGRISVDCPAEGGTVVTLELPTSPHLEFRRAAAPSRA